MKWFKFVAQVLGGMLLVLIGGGAYLVATFDANRYKALAIDWVREHKQRTLAIDGVGLSVFPRLQVKVSKAALSEQGSTATFAQLDEAGLELELLPLLRHEVAINRIELRGLRLQYLRDAQGRRNIDDLLEAEGGGRAAPAPKDGGTPRDTRLRLNAIRLSDVRVTIDDVPTGVKGEVALRTLASGPLSYDGASGALQARELKLETAGTLSDMQLDRATLDLQRFSFQPTRKALTLDKLAFALRGRRGEQPIEAKLSWPQLQIADQALKGSALQGEVALGGAQPSQVRFESAAPTGSFEQIRLPDLHVSLSGARKLAGFMRADITLQPSTAALALDNFDLQAQSQQPELKVALRGQLRASAKSARWQLAGALSEQAFDTQGIVTFGGAVPTVAAEATFARLDVDRLLPKPAPAAKAAVPAAPNAPVDLSALNRVNGNLALRATQLVRQPYRLDDARIDATLQGGVLRVGTLAGRIWGGSFDGSALADARSQRVSLKGTAQDIDLQAALRDVAQKDVLEGTGSVTLDVSAAGKTVNELKSRLAGNAGLEVRDGAIKGINLARTLRQAKAALSMRQDAVMQARQAEKTDFSELSASFVIADGVARSNDLDVKSPFLRLGGEGMIDIGRNRIDYTVRATVVETAEGQGGDELAVLHGLTVPVKLSGPLEAVDWQVQWSAVAAAAAEAAVRQEIEDKLKERLGVPASGASQPEATTDKDKLKDLLRGILR
jgi:AsmA protein